MSIFYCCKSDIGLKRSVNQDAIFVGEKENGALFVVADGMGGHEHGEKASACAVNRLREWWDEQPSEFPGDAFLTNVTAIRKTIEKSNEEIYKEYNQGGVCGTTVVVLFVYQKFYAIFSVGDSRIYRLRARKLTQLTMDDVWENQSDFLANRAEKEIEESKNKGKLTHALGIESHLYLHVKTDALCDRDVYLLCSDGMYKYFSPFKMKSVLKRYAKKADDDILTDISKVVCDGGASDNYSCILVKT